MKIKSWTGDDVDARVGMFIQPKHSKNHLSITKLAPPHCLWALLHNGNEFVFSAQEVTMTHCPFQVGDEFQELQSGEWVTIKWPMTQEVLDVCKNSVYIRHTNPSLRTSVEYKV